MARRDVAPAVGASRTGPIAGLLTSIHYRATAPDSTLDGAGLIRSSAFHQYAVISSAGARLSQVMPFLDQGHRPRDDNLFHMRNLRYGCTILRHYLDVEKGSLFRAGTLPTQPGQSRDYPNLVRAPPGKALDLDAAATSPPQAPHGVGAATAPDNADPPAGHRAGPRGTPPGGIPQGAAGAAPCAHAAPLRNHAGPAPAEPARHRQPATVSERPRLVVDRAQFVLPAALSDCTSPKAHRLPR